MRTWLLKKIGFRVIKQNTRMSSASQSYRTRSKTLPARVKSPKNIEQDSKSRSSLPFRRLADLLKRKRKRGKGEADPLNSLALDKQAWYHGKITADFAERYLRRDGNFLVREDPAMPGSCFIVVRHRRSAQHIQLCKVNSSKGTRIKYKIEDSDKSFDSISELINHHVAEKKPLSPTTSAVITHAVSRDATLLSTDDLKSPHSKHNRYVSNTGPANLCPPKPPGTGPLRQRKLERKNSDPGFLSDDVRGNNVRGLSHGSENQNRSYHTDNWKWAVQAKQRERIPEVFIQKGPKADKIENGLKTTNLGEDRNERLLKEASKEGLDRDDDQPCELENTDKLSVNESLAICNNTATQDNGDESYYDKPSEDSYYDKPTETENSRSFNDELPENAEAFYDKPVILGNDDSLYDQPKDSQESLYDKPRDSHERSLEAKTIGNKDILYDIPRDGQDNLYDKPSNAPKRIPSFRNSDPTPSVSSKVDKFHSLRPRLLSRCSAPSLRAAAGGSATSNAFSSLQRCSDSASRSKAPLEKRHSDVGVLLRQTPSKNRFSDGIDFKARDETRDDESYYSTPPTSLENPFSEASEQQDGDSLLVEQDEPHEISPLSVSRDSGDTNQMSPQNSKIKTELETPSSQPEPPKSVDKQGIFLSVMKKIRETLLLPFLECDCTSLARHMTRVDVSLIWGDNPAPRAWTFEDGTGGAEGLEMLTLPQGREMRADLLERFSDISNWVATLIVAAGDLSTREQVLSKLIELADALSDKLGNLVSFMAVMDGLCLPQVTRLHHTWSCLHHQHCSVAILYHSTLKPLASLLSSGAPSPFPGVCLPYMVPLMRYMEMTIDDILNDLEYTEVDLGLGTILAHLESGRILAQQIEEFRQEATARLQMEECSVDSKLIEYFNNKLNVASVLGLEASTTSRANKLRTLLQWLSEKAESPAHASS